SVLNATKWSRPMVSTWSARTAGALTILESSAQVFVIRRLPPWARRRDKWACRPCRSKDGHGVPSTPPCNPSAETDFLMAQLTSVNVKLEALLFLKVSVDALQALPAKLDELLLLKPIVEELKSTVQDVQASVNFFSAQYDSLLKLATSTELAVKTLQDEISDLQATVRSQATKILQVRVKQNDGEQYSRLPNLELQGLPLSPDENLISCMADLASKLSIDSSFHPSDIQESHRFPAKREGILPFLVQFSSVRVKETWMAKPGMLRSLSQKGCLPKLYFNDNLTRANKGLFWQARQKGKAQCYKFVWVKRAKIFAKKSEDSELVRINQLADIDKLV
ncbi:unnamed protein product, partial [Ixodes hexagonus]